MKFVQWALSPGEEIFIYFAEDPRMDFHLWQTFGMSSSSGRPVEDVLSIKDL